jgi:nucleoid-associated protein YgaU
MTISATNRTRVVVLLTSVGLALVILLTFTVSARADDAAGSPAEATFTSHVVASGDTLWDIASEFTPDGGDVRNVVVDIKAANHLSTSVIVPGQVLLIPSP